jgi:ATP-dependent DNA helicase RecG
VTANEVDTALAAEPADVGVALLGIREDQWFDRKSVRTAAKDLGKPLIAFANAEGGVIVVGLSEGVVEGFEGRENKLNEFRQAAIDHTAPPVRAQFSEHLCVNNHGRTDRLLVIRIEPSEMVHELKNGDTYLRIGDESRKLGFAARQELEYDKGQSQYDGRMIPGALIADLDQQLLENYRSRTGSTGTVRELLQARSLLTSSEYLTNAGYLLFATRPQVEFPQAYVRIIRYLTAERGTGARLGVEEGTDVRVEGPIPRMIHDASKEIEHLLPQRRSLTKSGLFEGSPIVPRDAWLEGLVNAVIHRSYSLVGDHIRVEIFPDRVEIESPGRFPGLGNPNRPLEISRFARNPRIARVCADLRIGQELGEGIKRIFEEMRRLGLQDPVYKQTGGSVKLVLTSLPRLHTGQAQRLPGGSQQVLDVLLSAGRGLGTGDIAEATGLSRPAITRRLQALKDEGMVEWHGKSKKDPRAFWTLAESR